MASTFDDRLVSITIIIGTVSRTYSGLYIYAVGTKYANENQNECEITIANLKEETRNEIMTLTSPFNDTKVEKIAIVSAGRVSYGLSQIFIGNIVSSSISQPPDIYLILKCLTGDYQKGNIIARTQPQVARLSNIAKQVAEDLGVTLSFEAQEKEITNYTYTGAAIKQIKKLGDVGEIDAYLDNNTLIVKDKKIPLIGKLRKLSASTGMVGIPESTELGVRVIFLLDNYTVLGGALEITSVINPALNGRYVIYKLGFEIANRDTPFYWVAEALRVQS